MVGHPYGVRVWAKQQRTWVNGVRRGRVQGVAGALAVLSVVGVIGWWLG